MEIVVWLLTVAIFCLLAINALQRAQLAMRNERIDRICRKWHELQIIELGPPNSDWWGMMVHFRSKQFVEDLSEEDRAFLADSMADVVRQVVRNYKGIAEKRNP